MDKYHKYEELYDISGHPTKISEMTPEMSKFLEQKIIKAADIKDYDTVKDIIYKGINLFYNNGNVLIQTVEDGHAVVLELIEPIRLTLFMIDRNRATNLVKASINHVWGLKKLRAGNSPPMSSTSLVYPALEIILKRDLRENKGESITYKNTLMEVVQDDDYEALNLLMNYINYEWSYYEEVIKDVIIPKLNTIDKEGGSIKHKIQKVEGEVYFLRLLVENHKEDSIRYFKEIMKTAKNGVVYVAPLIVLDEGHPRDGLDILGSFKEIKYEEYVSVYLINYAKYNRSDVSEKINKIKKKFKGGTENLSYEYPPISTIIGPVSWSYYKYKGKNIHIFGDYHVKSNIPECDGNHCMNIVQLFEYISNRSVVEEQLVNFYFETPYVSNPVVSKLPSKNNPSNSYLGDVVNEFKPCLQIEKKQCPYYPNAKYHYVDLRSSNIGYSVSGIFHIPGLLVDHPEKLIGFMNIMERVMKELERYPNIIFDMYIDKDNGRKIYESFISSIGPGIKLSENFKTGSNTHKVRWQLKNVNKKMSKLIRDFAYKQYAKSLDELFEVMGSWTKVKNDLRGSSTMSAIANFNIFISKLTRTGATFGAIFMDTYYLARLFRSMEWDKSCKLFITYAGEHHKKVYDKFFEELSEAKLIKKLKGQLLQYMDMPEQSLSYKKFGEIFGEELFE